MTYWGYFGTGFLQWFSNKGVEEEPTSQAYKHNSDLILLNAILIEALFFLGLRIASCITNKGKKNPSPLHQVIKSIRTIIGFVYGPYFVFHSIRTFRYVYDRSASKRGDLDLNTGVSFFLAAILFFMIFYDTFTVLYRACMISKKSKKKKYVEAQIIENNQNPKLAI
jgi:hypothetical protein